MQCPECQSPHIRKNGRKKGKQNQALLNLIYETQILPSP